MRGQVVLGAVVAMFVVAGAAMAADTPAPPPPPPGPIQSWLPHDANATWTYQWTDSVFNVTPTKEKVTVKSTQGTSFTLAWTTQDQGNADTAPVGVGQVVLQESSLGIVTTDWQSNQPPSSFPVLCAQASQCGNSLASTWYDIIWGSRSPTLLEPVLNGSAWASTGGFQNDVTSASRYLGTEQVTVAAFPSPVTAAKIETQITQAGALGDPYGSGIRTVWWVYGVGPVKVQFQHTGPNNAVTTSELVGTNLTPLAPPPDPNYFPLTKGKKWRYSFTNSKYLKKPSVTNFVVDQVSNGSARVSVKSASGPIKIAAAYGFTLRSDGVSSLWAASQSATTLKFPQLGPKTAAKADRRHFITPYDLLIYGFNPIVPAYGSAQATWSAVVPSRDYTVFGVTGTTTVVGTQTVKVPAGTFKDALVVRSSLSQDGFKYGTGTRTAWFAPGKGLVKLVFRHADGSVSTVKLLK